MTYREFTHECNFSKSRCTYNNKDSNHCFPTATGEDKRLSGMDGDSTHVVAMGVEVVNSLKGVVVKHADLKYDFKNF
jgi:hypothetical protein